MSISKKGSRKIVVNGTTYRWLVSKYRLVSDWRAESDILDDRFVEIAKKYGLGEVADVVFTIAIELFEKPRSKIIAKYFGLIVDGFMGPEQSVQVKPVLVKEVITKCLESGWAATQPGNFDVEIFEKSGSFGRSVVLFLPGMGEGISYDLNNSG